MHEVHAKVLQNLGPQRLNALINLWLVADSGRIGFKHADAQLVDIV